VHFLMKWTIICLDYVFVGVMMMKEKYVEENVLGRVMLVCKVWKWGVDCKRNVGAKNDGKDITLELHGEYG
jgi:hypothetical protein